ncbi:MAG: ion transporter [Leptospiraceae bacterium]|nr:ion transporter [Leptospiraceae bacterium]
MRAKLHEIIFEADTATGKWFDIVLIWSILISVSLVLLESVERIENLYGSQIYAAEWFFTILFTIEYCLRLMVVKRPLRYAISFYGLVDLLSIVPSYITFIHPDSHYFLLIRILRVMRVFRVLKLAQFNKEGQVLLKALLRSRHKIIVFLGAVLSVIFIMGATMYVIEGAENGFTSIPRGIYWAIVTMTTVGYGDIAPQTTLGQIVASIVMLLGYGILAVPTGIVTAELSRGNLQPAGVADEISTQSCPGCGSEGHNPDARYCRLCGDPL